MSLTGQLAGRYPDQPVPAELKRTTEDLAWFIADSFASLTASPARTPCSRSRCPSSAMARLDHPGAEAVLTMFGKHCGDKKTAKAARKAAYKAASRRASPRS